MGVQSDVCCAFSVRSTYMCAVCSVRILCMLLYAVCLLCVLYVLCMCVALQVLFVLCVCMLWR